MATRFQQLGFFSAVLENLTEGHIRRFAQEGGRWGVALMDQLQSVRSDSVEYNRAHIKEYRDLCIKYDVAPGVWVNGWGKDPLIDANIVAELVHTKDLRPVVLDLEAPYQHGNQFVDPETRKIVKGNADLMPALLKALRPLIPGTSIAVSTNAMNESGIFRDFRTLGIRCLPQWYSAYYKKDGNYSPTAQMAWQQKYGTTSWNFENGGVRGLPLSYIHGTLEVTGLEGSSLADEINEVRKSRIDGYTYGWSIYLLENIQEEDWKLIAAERGITYLV